MNKPKYPKKQLEDDANYIDVKDAVKYFPWMLKDKKYSPVTIRKWIQAGYLEGRIINISLKGDKYGNRWQVFTPDIERFKKERIKQI